MHERVQAALERGQVDYRLHRHADLDVPIRTPDDFASALGYEVGRVAKTLLFRSSLEQRYCLVVAPSNRRVRQEALGDLLWIGPAQLASREELAQVVGYPPAGVSPLGVDSITVLIDDALMTFPTILIGAGEIRVEVEISPIQLRAITRAIIVPLSVLRGVVR